MRARGTKRHTFVLALGLTALACAESHTVPPGPIPCGGEVCTGGYECCVLPGRAPFCTPWECMEAGDAGPPPPPIDAGPLGECGPRVGRMCPLGAYCDVGPSCDPMAIGVCREQPFTCPGIWAPVCGCDGVTYANDCLAQGTGMSVAYPGECEGPMPLDCGVPGGVMCPPNRFCLFAPGTCGGVGGTCAVLPSGCVGEPGVVCGCDGVTYPSQCAAHQGGVSVSFFGPCEPSVDCAPDEVRITSPACDDAGIWWTGTRCERWDGCCEGSGCDRGYGSLEECEAVHAPCLRACGGWVGPTCADDEFCDFADDWCDWADGSGVCRARPEGCPDPGGVPVCGCDGVTHPSLCEAQLTGVDAAYLGACM